MAASDELSVTIEGKTHKLDDFELGDLEWLEEYLGATLDDAKALASMKAAVGFVYLIKRKADPEFTIEDARKTRLSVFDVPAEKPAAKKRPTKAGAAG